MKLFGRKKDEKTQQPPVPFSPVNPQFPPATQDYGKKTLAQNLGLDKSDLPPLPPLPMGDIAPLRGRMEDLPPLPVEENAPDLSDLPPLPSEKPARLPQMTKETPEFTEPQGPAPTQPKAPIFIRLDKYNNIIDTVNKMESRINDLQNAIKKISEVKQKEKELIDNWIRLVDEAKEKINAVNTKLPQAKR